LTRGLSPAGTAAVQEEVVTRTSAVELLFASGAVRLNGSATDLVVDGQLFLGVGLLGAITTVTETADLQSAGISLTLSGVPRDAVTLARSDAYQNRRATVWEVLLDQASGTVIASAIIFRGRMDQMNIRLGEVATVEVTAEDRLTDMDRAALTRYTDEDQRRRYPTDRGFEFVSATAEKEIIWPARSWRE
jgi:hypothetical protein